MMSELDPDFPAVFLEHFEFDKDYQDQAELLDSSLSLHRRVPLFGPETKMVDGCEVVTLEPTESVNTRFDVVEAVFPPRSKDQFEPFARTKMIKKLDTRAYIVETSLLYFDDKYLALRSVYSLLKSDRLKMMMKSRFEREVTTEDLAELNTIVNNSVAMA